MCIRDSHASAQPYVIKRLGVEDGMSSNYVVSVAQDKKGYLWIATESGLNRFDGRQFNIYTKNNSGLSGNELVLGLHIKEAMFIFRGPNRLTP